MQLMEDLYQITQEPAMDDSNQRLFERLNTRLSARVLDITEFDETQVMINDISAGGLRMSGLEPLGEGTPVKVWVSIPGKKKELFLEGIVRWVREDNSDGWAMGLRFPSERMFNYRRLFPVS
jgi:hypothetical protein